jgi:hypothetical protein
MDEHNDMTEAAIIKRARKARAYLYRKLRNDCGDKGRAIVRDMYRVEARLPRVSEVDHASP